MSLDSIFTEEEAIADELQLLGKNIFQNMPDKVKDHLLILDCSYTLWVIPWQDMLLVPLGEDQPERLVNCDQLRAALEEDVSLASKEWELQSKWYLPKMLQVLSANLRRAHAWFMQELLSYEPFQYRTPSRQECSIILESLNAESKALWLLEFWVKTT